MSESALQDAIESVRAAAEARARRRHLAAQVEATAALVASRRTEVATLVQAHESEVDDVRRLERLSPTKIWATLRGNATDRLEAERAEADAAALALTAARSRLERATAEDARVRRAFDELDGADRRYDEALATYEDSLLEVDGPQAPELRDLAAQVGAAEAHRRELTEAQRALHVTQVSLDTALAKVNTAGGWSTYDTFFGGGLIADMVKHSKIDEANAALKDVNRALERLSVELADLEDSTLDGVDISQTLAVFDVLFDNIFSDWMVRDRISRAKASAERLEKRLHELDDDLGADAVITASRITALLERREALLTTAST